MGYWGIKPFENDDASDLAHEIGKVLIKKCQSSRLGEARAARAFIIVLSPKVSVDQKSAETINSHIQKLAEAVKTDPATQRSLLREVKKEANDLSRTAVDMASLTVAEAKRLGKRTRR